MPTSRCRIWDPQQAGELFTQILAGAGEEGVDAVFAGNDALAGAVVQVLQSQGREPVLLSGQDATVAGVQNVLAGWQTMTVYKSFLNEGFYRRHCRPDISQLRRRVHPEEQYHNQQRRA